MLPCTACGAFVRHADSCPACGRPALGVPRSAVAVLLGLAACVGDKGTDSGHTGDSRVPQPDYGTAYTDTFTDTRTETGADADTDVDADTDTEPAHTGTAGGSGGSGGGGGSGGATHTGGTSGLDYGVPTTN